MMNRLPSNFPTNLIGPENPTPKKSATIGENFIQISVKNGESLESQLWFIRTLLEHVNYTVKQHIASGTLVVEGGFSTNDFEELPLMLEVYGYFVEVVTKSS